MSKNRKGSPLLHFSALWHCSKISLKKFFGKFFYVPKGSPLQFFFIFCNQLEFHKAGRVLTFQFWALDMAPTLAVLGLFSIFKTLRFLSLRYSAEFRRSRIDSQCFMKWNATIIVTCLNIFSIHTNWPKFFFQKFDKFSRHQIAAFGPMNWTIIVIPFLMVTYQTRRNEKVPLSFLSTLETFFKNF